jgi:ADP-ribosylglycohydrolase
MALESALETSIKLLMKENDSRECIELLKLARDLAGKENPTPETVEKIGAGWTAGEALAIGVYCALVAGDDFRTGVLLSVNHSGDSDSTGSILGNILGVLLGHSGIPAAWLEQLELKNVISDLATDLHTGYHDTDLWWSRYPGF